MTLKSLKVLVVEDSALMRRQLRKMLESSGDIEVVTARDGQNALEILEEVDPDVITLDINMPVMDGLTCLSHIMVDSPRPVLMVSSLTDKGALATFEALEMGAVDYITKPDGTVSLSIEKVTQELLLKVKAAARSRHSKSRGLRQRLSNQRDETTPPPPPPPPVAPKVRPRPAVRAAGERGGEGAVLIGVSTGGPQTLEHILPLLPADFPWPVLVAQHMPGRFTEVFARRMNSLCALEVKEARRPTPLEPGVILVGRGDADMVIRRRGGRLLATSVPSKRELLWHPSVDRMVRSALELIDPPNLIGVQLTGMGYDGAEAMAELHARGGRTLAESEASAVVYGMPKELIDCGGADMVLNKEQVASRLNRWTANN